MKNSKLRLKSFRGLFCILYFAFLISAAAAQSTNQSFPTVVSSNEISGRIAARDIGDARLTSYFYTFSGNQGDVFINVQTTNFNGDIDVFTSGNLKPLTKITIYADDTNAETGRVVYLRQPAKLILRVEGRSPNDDAATFRIKFAGSFEPLQASADSAAPDAPEVKSENQTDVRVNSVGTIIEVKPKPTPAPREIIARKEEKPPRKKSAQTAKNKRNTSEKEIADAGENKKSEAKEIDAEEVKQPVAEEKSENEVALKKENVDEAEQKSAPFVVVTDNTDKQNASKREVENAAENLPEKSAEKSVGKTPKLPGKNKARTSAKAAAKPKAVTESKKVKQPNPLENVHLIILFKDGTRIERAMSEVIKVGVDKGVLTVIGADGAIGRYSILDVAKMTIE